MTDYKKKIDYQFVPGPINLMWALDNDCWKAICILIDKENYWKSRNKVFNGYFTMSIEELGEHLRMKNKKDVRLTLEAMYRAGIIDVKAENGKRLGAKIKINWEVINGEEIEWVEKLPRNAEITYCGDTNCTETSTNCTPTLEKEQNRTDSRCDNASDYFVSMPQSSPGTKLHNCQNTKPTLQGDASPRHHLHEAIYHFLPTTRHGQRDI